MRLTHGDCVIRRKKRVKGNVLWLVIRLTACLVILGLLLSSACAAGDNLTEGELLLYAVNAGKADALILKAGDEAFLVDTGYVRSRGMILYAMELLGVTRFKGVILTHTDKDHADGLEWLAADDIPVDAWYASAMFTGLKVNKHPAILAAERRGQEVIWLQAGDELRFNDLRISVLAPSKRSDGKDDNNSLVLMAENDGGRILLCGDMEYEEEAVLLRSGADLTCDVMKVANHGDNDTCSGSLIRASSPAIALISTSSAEKASTPDPWLLRRLREEGCEVLLTQDSEAGILISLSDAIPRAAKILLPEQPNTITGTLTADGEIILKNDGKVSADMSGWYLCTEKKGSLLVLPDGTMIPAGGTLVIGAYGSQTAVTWREKKAINMKKTDRVTLMDPWGRKICSMDNGL